jgi:hypothetical protein
MMGALSGPSRRFGKIEPVAVIARAKELTIPIVGDKKSIGALETFPGLPNFFHVATAAIGMPSGSRDLSRPPDGVRSLLVPILLQGGFGYEV